MAKAETYYARNRKARLKYQKDRYRAKSEELRAYQKSYRLANLATERERSKLRYENNRLRAVERQRINGKKWRQKYPEKQAAKLLAYRLAHPERDREKSARRRAAKRQTYIERIDFKKILRDANGICGICKEPFDLFGIDFDHIVPLSRGGAHITANIQATHSRCNRAKGAKVG